MKVYAVDIGGSTLKHGDVSALKYTVSPNYVRLNAKQHSAQIRRPIERGYVVNWTLQGDIWQDCLDINHDTSLLLTTPIFTPDKLLSTQDEVVFEEFQIAAYTTVVPQAMLPWLSNVSPICCVIDVGFSATHIVPMIHGRVLVEAVRRLNVGGKLLTNYLKECVSFRQWNMMDSFELINEVKEAVCRCSLDFNSDMRTPAVVEWALPDFVHTHHGSIVDPSKPMTAAQTLRLSVETVAIPEVLFHPSDIGLDQAGLAAGIVEAISACPSHVQGFMYQHLVVSGGTSQFSQFVARLEQELRPLVPGEFPIKIHVVDDPIGGVWRGCQAYATSSDFTSHLVTKAEYLEHGSPICREKTKDRGF
ncbi:unnamed protein product [Aphanomyces euteiches]|uniref:Actin-related protein 6 n=1 Tax=Aphanomyces euteiches TaxID=100861 RepID=A0A6G0X6I4_9STRA|nr:hypothetical protein Ae201684_008049 [Aphanomyces euteiches]KAH9074514.1 hypothetical protein Ae201684P_022321 [Aphanomyces euteiches]